MVFVEHYRLSLVVAVFIQFHWHVSDRVYH